MSETDNKCRTGRNVASLIGHQSRPRFSCNCVEARRLRPIPVGRSLQRVSGLYLVTTTTTRRLSQRPFALPPTTTGFLPPYPCFVVFTFAPYFFSASHTAADRFWLSDSSCFLSPA